MATEIYRLVGDDESCAVLTANPVRGDICVTRNDCWLGPSTSYYSGLVTTGIGRNATASSKFINEIKDLEP